ncbi:unnamed protein product [Amoebophrya sp. A120]|nr:unnamed protein product [Amoebophrya sp. A120]|eukprot:GSA120T00019655001.1
MQTSNKLALKKQNCAALFQILDENTTTTNRLGQGRRKSVDLSYYDIDRTKKICYSSARAVFR